jgi:hypothetical protein
MWKQFGLNRNAAINYKHVFINRASGGSEYYQNGDTNNWAPSPDGANYDAAVTDIAACLSFLGLTKPRAIFLILGINDSRGAQSLASIQTAINSLFTRITTDFPGVPIYVANNGTDDVSEIINARKFTVNKYIKEAITTHSTVAERTLNMYSFYPWALYNADDLHLLQTGYNKAGELQDRAIRNPEPNRIVRQVQNGFYDALSDTHKAAWETFVEGCVSDGNWSLVDSLQIFKAATQRANVLIEHTGLFAPIESTFGFVANDRITSSPGFYKTNFIPSVCLVNSAVDDFLCGVYMAENNTIAGSAGYCFGATGGTSVRLFQNTSSQVVYGCNDTTATVYAAGDTRIAPDTWHTIGRNAGTKEYYKNATLVHSASVAVGAACTSNIYIGAQNNAGTSANVIGGGFRAWYWVKRTGFNLSAWHSRLDTLLAALV